MKWMVGDILLKYTESKIFASSLQTSKVGETADLEKKSFSIN